MTVKHAEKPLNSVSASKEGVVHITENCADLDYDIQEE